MIRRFFTGCVSLILVLMMPLNASMDSILSISVDVFLTNTEFQSDFDTISALYDSNNVENSEEEDSSESSNKNTTPIEEEIVKESLQIRRFLFTKQLICETGFNPKFWHFHTSVFSIDSKDKPMEPPENKLHLS